MTVQQSNVIEAARAVCQARKHGRSWALSETLRQLAANVHAMDHDTPPDRLAALDHSLTDAKRPRALPRQSRRRHSTELQ